MGKKKQGRKKKLKFIIFLFFNGKDENYKDKNFESTRTTIIFGGIELDLREAIIGDEPVKLDIKGRFSGFSIKVNPEWNVKLEGTSSKSGISNDTVYDENNKDVPQLIIRYDLKFSGLEIK